MKLSYSTAHLQCVCSSQMLHYKARQPHEDSPISDGVHRSSSQVEIMAIEAEKKRKHTRSWDHPARISQIKNALEEVIANIDPKEAETHQILGHLTAAHKAMEMACSILPGDEQMQTTMNTTRRPKHQVTMVGRSILFQQWQARRSNPTRSTSEPRPSCLIPVRRQR